MNIFRRDTRLGRDGFALSRVAKGCAPFVPAPTHLSLSLSLVASLYLVIREISRYYRDSAGDSAMRDINPEE